uniref:Amino acid adenylation domain-containing protein n=1 Tax=Candidatus Kentrum sp. FM TaxID=2126340 RepID=A0A450VYU7_9GAMM|nr:MAG: amino acid adenylation domain-containing protein [Candidatus Kentron sp. FM]
MTRRTGHTRSGHPLLGQKLDWADTDDKIRFESEIDLLSIPWLADHRVFDAAVFPATGYLEMVLAAGADIAGAGVGATGRSFLRVNNVAIEQALILPGEEQATIQLVLSQKDSGYRFEIFSRNEESGWTPHAAGDLVAGENDGEEPETVDLGRLQNQCPTEVMVTDHYQSCRERGLNYGPGFQGITRILRGDGMALAEIELPESLDDGTGKEMARYRLHPALLDAALQVSLSAMPDDGTAGTYLPVSVEELRVHGSAGSRLWALARSAEADADTVTVDVTLLDGEGTAVAEVLGLTVSRVGDEVLRRHFKRQGDDLYEIAWRAQALEDDGATAQPSMIDGTPGSWLIFADSGGLGVELAGRLEAAGNRCILAYANPLPSSDDNTYHLDPANPGDFQHLFAEAFQAQMPPLAGIVHLWSLDAPDAAESAGLAAEELTEAQTLTCGSVLHLVQAGIAQEITAGLWLVTRNAVSVAQTEDPLSISQAPLWGLGKVITQEHPELHCARIDLDPKSDKEIDTDALYREIRSDTKEDQIAFRNENRYVARLVRYRQTHGGLELPDSPYRLQISERGTLDNLELARVSRRPPQPGEVEIRVRASGLNFRDVLNALGMYPGDPGPLGGECAGEIAAVGEGVEEFEVGDPVMAMAPGSFGRYVTVPADMVSRKPEGIGFEEAATIPVVFLTAYHALHHLAKLSAGDRVLIHAAAGGVGLAAIQLAQLAGAQVFATASPPKWAFLESIGIEHIMNSRTTDFAGQIMEMTGGQGVDVVLNSLTSEDFIERSLSALGTGGRFLEISKAGVWQPEQVRQVRPDVDYFLIDLAETAQAQPTAIQAMLEELMPLFEAGKLQPLRHKTFPLTEAVGAFRYMQQARHIGKIILTPPIEAGEGDASAPPIRQDGAYLITGGLGALGLEVARWMVGEGARHLVLMGRRGPSEKAQSILRELEAAGAQVSVASADVSDYGRMADLFEELNGQIPPLKGIIHAAGLLDDGVLAQQDMARFERVLAPKLAGSWNLHTLTRDRPLDFFVCFSSVASLLGNAGQGNYASANAFMDALVYYRRALGLPGLSINWGAWAEIGLAAEMDRQQQDRLAVMGMGVIDPERGLSVLGKLMGQTQRAQVGVCPMDWSQFFKQSPEVPAFLSEFAQGALPVVESVPIRQQLAQATEEEYEGILTGFIRNRLANVLGTSSSRLDVRQPMNTMGLDSLMAVELRNRIRSELDVDVSMAKWMQGTSIFGLVEQIIEQIGKQSTQTHALEKASRQKTSHPLSHGQQALWFLYQNAPESPAYNTAAVVRILSPVDGSALRAVFQTLLDRHPSLRTTFSQRDGQIVQIVHGHRDLHLERIDASQDTEEALHRRVTAAYRRPFDLEQGPLFRISLFTRTQEDHVLLVAMHHIIDDGWSVWMLLSEFLTLYPARKTGEAVILPPLRWQYPDFVKWQTELLAGPEGEQLWEYWREQLSDAPSILDLPTDRPRPPVQSDNGASITFRLSETLTQQLKEQAQNSGATLYMILLAAFQVLLHRYTGQEDILVGSPIVGRARAEFEGIFGLFMNPIVLRARLEGDPSFASFLNQVRQTVLGGLAHQDYPISLLIERLQPARDASHSPLVQVHFLLQKPQQGGELLTLLMGNSDDDSKVNEGGLLLAPFKMAQQEGQSDLTLEMLEAKRALFGDFKYNTDLFEAETIERMVGHFQRLLEGIVAEPETRISRLSLLTETERQRILVEWNDTKTPYPADKCVHELFEEQAAKTPNALALVFPSTGSGPGEDDKINYGELNARANRLAHRLRKLGVGPEVLVGLFVERSVEMIVGLLGIMKAGGAYVPLDPDYPAERLAFMSDDANLAVLLCHGATREKLPECTARILDMDVEAVGIAKEDPSNPAPLAMPDNLAYVIYTSGSTGRPKGVMVEQGMVAGHIPNVIDCYGLKAEDRVLQSASISFDASVDHIFGAFLAGATLIVRGVELWTPEELVHNVVRHKITVIHVTPVYVHQLLEATVKSPEAENTLSLRLINSEGDVLLPETMRLWRQMPFHTVRLFNTYGPTETTVTATAFEVFANPVKVITNNTPIGKPLPGRAVYVLDTHGNPVPIGIPGELYIGGAGVARGYLNRPDLTFDKFIPDPFSDDAIGDDTGARLYRTGDLCRWLPDGNIEYLGRIDTQVKIRGFRIECGEVENALLLHPDVREAVVDARREGAQKQLVAWVVATDVVCDEERTVSMEFEIDDAVAGDAVRSAHQPTTQPSRDELRAHLREQLPEWMVPSVFVFVDALPLTPSGKIDRRVLPEPSAGEFGTEGKYIAPHDSVEDALCRVFVEVLDAERAGIHDNFFDLGGHSLLAIRMLSLIRERLGVELPLRVLFEHASPAELAMAVREQEEWQPAILFPLKTGPSKSSNPKPPLFCIHPVGGGALCYRELASHLDEDQPVYGIQAVGFEGEVDPLTSIEAMAMRYVEEVTALYPEGPCHLYGWSFGGVVAFEMARLLQAAGREVGLLALADTVHPSWFENREVPDEDDIMVYLLAEAGDVEPASFGELRGMTPKDRLAHLRQRSTTGSGLTIPENIDRFVRIYRANIHALQTCRLSPWTGRMIFLSAEERLDADGEPIDVIWGDYTNRLDHYVVPGNHFTMHRQPNVSKIAEMLEGVLAEIRQIERLKKT